MPSFWFITFLTSLPLYVVENKMAAVFDVETETSDDDKSETVSCVTKLSCRKYLNKERDGQTDDVKKYRSTPVSRYFCDGILS